VVSILYFAYGSNLLRERLLARCPTLTYAGRATLPAHRLTFDKQSRDGSGKCALESSDTAEGPAYERTSVKVLRAGEPITAVTYDARQRESGSLPYDWYLALVVAGAEQQGLSKVYVNRLRATSFLVDRDLERRARTDAIEALKLAGMAGVLEELVKRYR
jgi:hypothetical protein